MAIPISKEHGTKRDADSHGAAGGVSLREGNHSRTQKRAAVRKERILETNDIDKPDAPLLARAGSAENRRV